MKHMILKNGEYACGEFIPEGAVLCEDRPSYRHKWIDGGWVFQEGTELEALTKIRSKRNRLLAETDWWASSDLTMSAKRKSYRQALRDLPASASPSLDESGQLTGVTWPTKPA